MFSLKRFSPIWWMNLIAVLCFCSSPNLAQFRTFDLKFKALPHQLSFEISDVTQPYSQPARLEIYSFTKQKLFSTEAVAGQPLTVPLATNQRWLNENDRLICIVTIWLEGGRRHSDYCLLTVTKGIVNHVPRTFISMFQSDEIALSFYEQLVQLAPNDWLACYLYGKVLYDPGTTIPNLQLLTPPPPPKPPPPPPPPSKETRMPAPVSSEEVKQAEQMREQKLKLAERSFYRALTLTSQCREVSEVQASLAATYAALGEESSRRMWLQNLLANDCLVDDHKALIYQSLATSYWQCAYDLSRRYANPKATDPFHTRIFTNPADRQTFDECCQQGLAAINQALTLVPDHVEALYYLSLLKREQQKGITDTAEKRRIAAEAEQITQKATNLQMKREAEMKKREPKR